MDLKIKLANAVTAADTLRRHHVQELEKCKALEATVETLSADITALHSLRQIKLNSNDIYQQSKGRRPYLQKNETYISLGQEHRILKGKPYPISRANIRFRHKSA